MNASKLPRPLAAALLFALGTFTGCESTDSGSTRTTTNVYYGVGFYDPWYYGDYHDDHIIVAPPRPGGLPDQGLRPEHPIARPPDASSRPPAASQLPATRPTPSIPSSPRPAFSGGGRGGGGGRR